MILVSGHMDQVAATQPKIKANSEMVPLLDKRLAYSSSSPTGYRPIKSILNSFHNLLSGNHVVNH